jgi:hypothetical protein
MMKWLSILAIPAIGTLLGCSASESGTGGSNAFVLTQKVEWRGQGGGFAEWGQSKEGFFGTSVRPFVLETWKWDGPVPRKAAAFALPPAVRIGVLPDGRYMASVSPGDSYTPWPFVIASIGSNEVLKKWERPVGWQYQHVGISRNGRFAAATLNDSDANPQQEVGVLPPRHKIGLVKIAEMEIDWVAELTGRGGDTVRQIAVSDNGEYIAVGGWRNGIALVSTSLKQVLWDKMPPGEISTGYVAFSSDGSRLYAGGSAGCVFAFETKTGNLTGQWYGSRTGRAEYGHRISCLAISPDDVLVAAGTGPEGEVYVFNTVSYQKPQLLNHGLTTILILSFSPDSKYLASVAGGMIKIWSAARSPRTTVEAR